MRKRHVIGRSCLVACLWAVACATPASAAPSGLRAGAAAVDVTPTQFPVIVNGGFFPVIAKKASDPLHARALVLSDGDVTLAIVVVDSCLMPRDLLDEAKARAAKSTGIPADRMLISATHTHSAPAAMGALGTDVDPNYPPLLKDRLVEAIERAHKNLAPAKAAWGMSNAADYTATRRWIRRPDRVNRDPFGELTVRAHMHPGHLSADAVGPSGPEDPDLTVLSIRHADGKPLALLANFAMHYFAGVTPLSSDYFGPFCDKVAKRLGAGEATAGRPPFVGIMSQGTSGDSWRMDYSQPKPKSPITLDQYADDLARLAVDAVARAEHRADVTLAMAHRDVRIKARGPSPERLAWAKKVVAEMAGRPPKTHTEVYAREAIFLHERPEADMLIQAIRVGDFGITALPNEVYAITGLKIKAQSPLPLTMNVELANDELGYIPPPEQHKLGGYTTWPARSSYPDVDAEPKMVETALSLLEQVSGKPRRKLTDTHGPYARAILDGKPLAYWRGSEMAGTTALDAAGAGNAATYEDGVAFYLEGPESPAFSGDGVVNRAPHFAGGRLAADLKDLGPTYTASFWFWNGLSNDARPVTGYLFSRGPADDKDAPGDHLGIGGTFENGAHKGRLIFFNGNKLNTTLAGRSVIEPKTWNHVVLVRAGKRVTVYLNGHAEPEIIADAEVAYPPEVKRVFVGGRSDNFANLEGKVDEVALFNRAVPQAEAVEQFRLANVTVTPPPATQPAKAVAPPSAPRSPAEALRTLRVKDGYAVELVAAEPLVRDPIALAFGPDGNLWVAEMADYPYGIDGRMKPSGRVRFVEDADGDGRYDRSTVFLDGINFPTGVLPWRKGVLVTAAPDIFYAEDTTGDGVADKRDVIVTGFTQGNPQLRVNTLAWGLDNWVYVANGMSSNGTVRSPKTGQEVKIGGRDLRFRPDDGAIDAESGLTEFGRSRNDWGDWFGNDNSHPFWHFVLPDRYARRNPFVASPKPTNWMGLKPNPQVFPISKAQKRYHSFEHVGHYTSACSPHVYRDDLLVPRDAGGVEHGFVCEPVGNLVQHLVLKPDGVTFAASRAADEPNSDFLASDDEWFRPVFVTTGPDGALWVADMYRYMIEHPDWLPQAGKDDYRPFYRSGEENGRVYRVFPKDRRPRAFPRLDKLDAAGLVAALDSPNGWQRDTAHQMLLWRNDRAAVGPLRSMAAKHANPLARLHALAVLDGLNTLTADDVQRALTDAHPAVRRHALVLAEPRAKDAPQLVDAAAKLAEDADPKVRFQLAHSLGEWDGPVAGAALARVAASAGGDAWTTAAVVSSMSRHHAAVASALLDGGGRGAAGPVARALLTMSLARQDRDLTARLLSPALTATGSRFTLEQLDTVGAFLDLADARPGALAKLEKAKPDALADAIKRLPATFDAARALAADNAAAPDVRAAAAALLGREPSRAADDLRALSALLGPRTPTDVQTAAVRAIGRIDSPEVPARLTRDWPAHSPLVRGAIADVLLAKEPGAHELLREIEAGRIAPTDLDAARRQRLLQHRSQRVKALAGKLFGVPSDAARAKTIAAYQSALATAKPDAARGATVFAHNCATCHRLGEAGQEVGPNLQSVVAWPAENLLTAILDPNRSAEPRFLAYTATLHTGEPVFGIITSETGNGLTMKGLDGRERTLARADVQSLVGTNRSLMPDGLEAAISPEQMADLIAYLRGPVAGK